MIERAPVLPEKPNQVDLVITNPPAGMLLRPELGIFRTPWEGIQEIGENYVFMVGSSIGLEWRSPNSEKVQHSDVWANQCCIAATYDNSSTTAKGATDKKPELIYVATSYEPNHPKADNLNCKADDWISYLESVNSRIRLASTIELD